MDTIELTVSDSWEGSSEGFSLRCWRERLWTISPWDTVASIQDKLRVVLWEAKGFSLEWDAVADFVEFLKRKSDHLVALIIDEEILNHNLCLKWIFKNIESKPRYTTNISNTFRNDDLIDWKELLTERWIMFLYGTEDIVRTRVMGLPNTWKKLGDWFINELKMKGWKFTR